MCSRGYTFVSSAHNAIFIIYEMYLLQVDIQIKREKEKSNHEKEKLNLTFI